MNLPIDIIVTIASHCKLRDISALRLACKLFSQRITKQVQLTAYRAILEQFWQNTNKKLTNFMSNEQSKEYGSGYITNLFTRYISGNIDSLGKRIYIYMLIESSEKQLQREIHSFTREYSSFEYFCYLQAIRELLRTIKRFHKRYNEYILMRNQIN